MNKILFTVLLVLASQIFAESAATVLSAQKATAHGHEISRGAVLNVGDEVVTSKEGAANIQYKNGSLVNIGSSSNYKILAYTPKKAEQIKAELSKGKIEIKSPEKIKESLKTPITSLAILGTDIKVYVDGKTIYIEVIEGLILAGGQYFQAGSSFRITSDGKVEPAPFPKEGEVKATTSSNVSSTTGAGTPVSGSSGTGVDAISYVDIVSSTSTSTSAGIAAAQTSLIADISLICF